MQSVSTVHTVSTHCMRVWCACKHVLAFFCVRVSQAAVSQDHGQVEAAEACEGGDTIAQSREVLLTADSARNSLMRMRTPPHPHACCSTPTHSHVHLNGAPELALPTHSREIPLQDLHSDALFEQAQSQGQSSDTASCRCNSGVIGFHCGEACVGGAQSKEESDTEVRQRDTESNAIFGTPPAVNAGTPTATPSADTVLHEY